MKLKIEQYDVVLWKSKLLFTPTSFSASCHQKIQPQNKLAGYLHLYTLVLKFSLDRMDIFSGHQTRRVVTPHTMTTYQHHMLLDYPVPYIDQILP